MKIRRKTLRKIRHGKRGSTALSINLVPMIDVFVILVIYLLVNAAAVQVVGAEQVELPKSIAEQPPKEENVAVTVSGDDILVNGKKVMNVTEATASSEPVLKPLRDELMTFLAPPAVVAAAAKTQTPLAPKDVSIFADKKIPYSLLKRVMATCADAGFAKIALGVLPDGGGT
ncbi:MAG: biopolymer transporter ExbD [Pseudomonadota bacterium]